MQESNIARIAKAAQVTQVFLTFWDPFEPIWTPLDHVKQKMIFCSEAPPPNSTLFLSEYNFQDDGHK